MLIIIKKCEEIFSISIKFFLFFPLYFNISNITINIKKCIKKKHFTFHHYWGGFLSGGFCPVPTYSKKLVTENSPDVIGSMLFLFYRREVAALYLQFWTRWLPNRLHLHITEQTNLLQLFRLLSTPMEFLHTERLILVTFYILCVLVRIKFLN